MAATKRVRVFVSSPGDVGPERDRVEWVANRLNGEFAGVVHFETLRWEHKVYTADEGGFQGQIENPADCDIVICIFWSRLGTPLPDTFPERMPDGRAYGSGTAFEVLSALRARKENRTRPDVYVFRKNAIPTVPINDLAARAEADSQWTRLEDFFAEHFESADKRILRVVERFRETGEFEKKIEGALRDWVRANVSRGEVWSVDLKGSPFRGLEPFDARHADIYFGRERKIRRAIDELTDAAARGKPFLLIPGASGAGKSSLMRAGIAPRLVRPGTVKDVDVWRTAVMRPGGGEGPFEALARALFVAGTRQDDPGGFGAALPELGEGAFTTPERLAEFFAGSTRLAPDPIKSALAAAAEHERTSRGFDRPLRSRLLLLVDQMEDLFSEAVDEGVRGQFADLLSTLVDSGVVWVVATVRGDLYERIITERAFIALKDMGGQYDLGPPGRDELEEIIHRSAEAAGLTYEERVAAVPPAGDGRAGESRAGGDGRERLHDRLLADAVGENALPLLQFALNLMFDRMWNRDRSKVLSIADYEAIGGIDGAVNQTAELAVARLVADGDLSAIDVPLPAELEERVVRDVEGALENLLRKLVVPVRRDEASADTSSERGFTARMVPIDEARRGEAELRLVDALLSARVLLVESVDGWGWLKIAHDRVISSWKRARKLVEKNHEFYRVRNVVEESLDRWKESGCSAEYLLPAGTQSTLAKEAVEKFRGEFSEEAAAFVAQSSRRARSRQRALTAATVLFGIVAVVASASAWQAWKQGQRADEARIAAERDYAAARGTVGRLVGGVTDRLKDADGITAETIETALNEAEGLVEDLLRVRKDDLELQRIRAAMHTEFAKVFQGTRNLERAMEEAETGLRIRGQLASAKEATAEWMAEHASSLDLRADIRVAMALRKNAPGDPDTLRLWDEARTGFEESLAIREKLFADAPRSSVRAVELSQTLTRLGDHDLNPGRDPDGAMARYRRALDLMKGVLTREPDEVKWQREISWNLLKMAKLKLDSDPKMAIGFLRQGLTARRHVAARDPNNTLWKRDLSFALERLAQGYVKVEQFDDAQPVLFESLALRRELVSRDAFQRRWQNELADTLRLVGQTFAAMKRHQEAAGFFHMEYEVWKRATSGLAKVDAQAEAAWKKAEKARDDEITKIDKVVLVGFADVVEAATNVEARFREERLQRGSDERVEWDEFLRQLLQPARTAVGVRAPDCQERFPQGAHSPPRAIVLRQSTGLRGRGLGEGAMNLASALGTPPHPPCGHLLPHSRVFS